MDIFDEKSIKPMGIYRTIEPFNSVDFLYEIKYDGIRCIAYLDENETDLRDKNNVQQLDIFPELSEIHRQIKRKCILDGELVVFEEGKADFPKINNRVSMNDLTKIQAAASEFPATYVVFDIIYLDTEPVTEKYLLERKLLLTENLIENERIILSRTYERDGKRLLEIVKEQKLEGIIAKEKRSKYCIDSDTKYWIKCLPEDVEKWTLEG